MIFVFDETFTYAITTFLNYEERGMLFSAMLYSNSEDGYPFENHPELSTEKVEIFYSLLINSHKKLLEDYYG